MSETGHTSETGQRRSTVNLLADVVNDLVNLVRKEGQLASAEIQENVDNARRAIGALVAGAICLIAALVVLLDAVIIGVANLGIPVGWAALLVGIVVAAVGFWLLSAADENIEGRSAMPTKTIQQIKEDTEAVRRSFKR